MPSDGQVAAGSSALAKKAEHKLMNSRAKHRGPMDEMRQLVRILAKMMPQSQGHLQVGDEGGGGNRISEDQIKHYLAATLGNLAPKPEWGLPQGWGQYLAGARFISCFARGRCCVVRYDKACLSEHM